MTDARPVLRSYLPGEWFAVLAPDLVLALPPDRRDLAAAAWAAVDGGAGPDEVLDLVLADGLSGLAGLTLVSREGTRTRAVARGTAVCRLASATTEVVADGRAAATLTEVSLDHVTALSVELGALEMGALEPGALKLGALGLGPSSSTAEGDRLVVADGLVRAAHLLWSADPTVLAIPDDSSVDVPPARGGPLETAPVVVSAPRQPDDHDGLTRDGSSGAADLGHGPVGLPGQPPVPPITSHPVAVLVLSTGERLEVDRPVVLGRDPQPRRFTTTEQPRLVTVASPQQEISSTHLEVRPGTGADHGSAVVTDLGSTNGTVLTQPGLPAEPLHPGIPVQLLPGAVIDLGDGLTITVGRP